MGAAEARPVPQTGLLTATGSGTVVESATRTHGPPSPMLSGARDPAAIDSSRYGPHRGPPAPRTPSASEVPKNPVLTPTGKPSFAATDDAIT